MKKTCTRCQLPKHIDRFSPKSKTNSEKRQSRCKPCMVEVQKEHRHANPGSQQARNARLRQRLKDFIDGLKNTPCKDCKRRFPPYVMDFDHLDPKQKVANVAYLVKHGCSAKLLEEIKKCDIVCANCHRVRTHERGQYAPKAEMVPRLFRNQEDSVQF